MTVKQARQQLADNIESGLIDPKDRDYLMSGIERVSREYRGKQRSTMLETWCNPTK